MGDLHAFMHNAACTRDAIHTLAAAAATGWTTWPRRKHTFSVCDVVGHNGERCEVRVCSSGETLRLKMCNLLPVENAFSPAHGPGIPEPELLTRLRAVTAEMATDESLGPGSERDDMRARVAYMRSHLGQGKVPPPSPCLDPLVPAHQLKGMVKMLQNLKPCCNGDGTVVFSRFADGLVGNSEQCAVCMEKMSTPQPTLAFPCGHMFHKQCAAEWLSRKNTCPTCRLQLGTPGHEYTYMFDYDERVTTRLREWFISGMCECCQAVYHEKDPLVGITMPDGTHVLTVRSRLPPGHHAAPAPV